MRKTSGLWRCWWRVVGHSGNREGVVDALRWRWCTLAHSIYLLVGGSRALTPSTRHSSYSIIDWINLSCFRVDYSMKPTTVDFIHSSSSSSSITLGSSLQIQQYFRSIYRNGKFNSTRKNCSEIRRPSSVIYFDIIFFYFLDLKICVDPCRSEFVCNHRRLITNEKVCVVRSYSLQKKKYRLLFVKWK